MTMWVRTATKQDLLPISRLLATVWHSTYDTIYGQERVAELTAQWHSVEALADKLNAPRSEFLVANDGNQISAMAYASQIDDTRVKVHQLYILPQFHRQGIGRLLLDEIESCFFDANEFMLEVEEQNHNAVRFYEKNGYRLLSRTANCGEAGSGIPALVYTKSRLG